MIGNQCFEVFREFFEGLFHQGFAFSLEFIVEDYELLAERGQGGSRALHAALSAGDDGSSEGSLEVLDHAEGLGIGDSHLQGSGPQRSAFPDLLKKPKHTDTHELVLLVFQIQLHLEVYLVHPFLSVSEQRELFFLFLRLFCRRFFI